MDGVRRYAREYGGLTLIWILGRPALVLNDPELIGEVLDTRAADFYKKSPQARSFGRSSPTTSLSSRTVRNGRHSARAIPSS